MRRASFRRAEEASRNLTTQAEKVSPDTLGTALREHATDVLNEDEPSAGLDEDPSCRTPKVSRIVSTKAFTGEAVGLARDAANDAIHSAAKASAWDGSHIAPDRSWSHDALAHLRHQASDGEGLPLHTHDRLSTWNRQSDGAIEAATSGAEGDEVEAGSSAGM
jgi:hypothetical protein